MPITLHILKPPASVIAVHHELVNALYSADLDLQHVPDPSMRDAAAKLSQIVGYEVPAHKVITLEIDPANADQQIGQIEHLAFVDKLLVFLGDAGLYVNASGLDLQETFVPVQMTSSTGTVWRQVGERTVDIAFEDALRAPDPVGAWILVVTTYRKADTYGGSLSMRLEADGQWTLTLRYVPAESGGQKPAQTLRVPTYEEARAILLAFADICEEIHELDWRDAAPGEATLRPMAYMQSMPLRRLDAVADLPAGTMMRLRNLSWGELRYGRDASGAWNATETGLLGVRISRDFDTLDELMVLVYAYVTGQGNEVSEMMQNHSRARTEFVWDKDVVEATAMVLPERSAPFMNSTIRFLHHNRACRNRPASAQMRDFVDSVNRELADFLVDGPAEPADLTSLRLRNPGAIPQLYALAKRSGVSVVVHGDHVLYNSSGEYEKGHEPDPVVVFNNGLPFLGWKVPSLNAFTEAIGKVAAGCVLSVLVEGTVGTRGHRADYQTMIFDKDGQLTTTLLYPDGSYFERDNISLDDASWIYSIAGDFKRITDPSLWERSGKVQVEENRRLLQVLKIGPTESAGRFHPVAIERILSSGLNNAGDRYCILDVTGDDAFVEVRRVDQEEDPLPYIVEAHYVGDDDVTRNYSFRLADLQVAMRAVSDFAAGEMDQVLTEAGLFKL